MPWEAIAPMMVMMTGILTAGGVLILRPLAKNLASYLRTLEESKRLGPPTAEVAHLRDTLSNIESRLALLEERQNFTENLLSRGIEPTSLPSSRTPPPS